MESLCISLVDGRTKIQKWNGLLGHPSTEAGCPACVSVNSRYIA
jgi:hypothetical protein